MAYVNMAEYYDYIYGEKQYGVETVELVEILHSLGVTSKKSKLLDVACGTGGHLEHLVHHFKCTGIDNSGEMLDVAFRKLSNRAKLYTADMTDFNLKQSFDAITCMFSAIGYAVDMEKLQATMHCFAAHLKEGGVVIINPWFEPDGFTDGHVSWDKVDTPELKISRMSISHKFAQTSLVKFYFQVGIPGQGVKTFEESHTLGLFTKEEMISVMEQAGFTNVHYRSDTKTPRGLYVGVKA